MPTMERRTLPQLGHRHLYITFTEFWGKGRQGKGDVSSPSAPSQPHPVGALAAFEQNPAEGRGKGFPGTRDTDKQGHRAWTRQLVPGAGIGAWSGDGCWGGRKACRRPLQESRNEGRVGAEVRRPRTWRWKGGTGSWECQEEREAAKES